MQKINDFIYEYHPSWQRNPTICRVRVYGEAHPKIVVLTEDLRTLGNSVTNTVEHIATAVWQTLGNPAVVWYQHDIEHPKGPNYVREVKFSQNSNRLEKPQWQSPLNLQKVEEELEDTL